MTRGRLIALILGAVVVVVVAFQAVANVRHDASLAAMPTPSAPAFDHQQYDRIQDGMHAAQVQAIFGTAGSVVYESSGPVDIALIKWVSAAGDVVTVELQAGAVISKSVYWH